MTVTRFMDSFSTLWVFAESRVVISSDSCECLKKLVTILTLCFSACKCKIVQDVIEGYVFGGYTLAENSSSLLPLPLAVLT